MSISVLGIDIAKQKFDVALLVDGMALCASISETLPNP